MKNVREDAFGTPPAARSGMMTVAGASDEDEDGQLITDDDQLDEGLSLLRVYVQEVIGRSVRRGQEKSIRASGG